MSQTQDMRIKQHKIDKILNFINDFKDTEFNSLEHAIFTLTANGIPMKNTKKDKYYFTFSYLENTYVIAFRTNVNHRLEINRVEVLD